MLPLTPSFSRVAALCTRVPIHQSENPEVADRDLTPIPYEDPSLERSADLPFRGIRYDGDGNVADPLPGPARVRAVALQKAWRAYCCRDHEPDVVCLTEADVRLLADRFTGRVATPSDMLV
ncbi:MAG: hypothetical protein OXQ31_20725 [Spirochaetaceae bacterium]|nr:hypothetical protein [Spirochaetaceae bacterium]